jgi:hypothetical protein
MKQLSWITLPPRQNLVFTMKHKIRMNSLKCSLKLQFQMIKHFKSKTKFKSCIYNFRKWAFNLVHKVLIPIQIQWINSKISNNLTVASIKTTVISLIIMPLRFKFNNYKINWSSNSNKYKFKRFKIR